MKIHQFFQFYKRYEAPVNILLLVTLSVGIFYNSLGSYYLNVDDLGIVPHTTRNIGEVFARNPYGVEQGGNYRPIEVLSHMFDSYLYGHNNPFGRRLTNLFIHLLNVIAVYLIAFFMTRIKVIGLVAGLLFAVHPVHSQALTPVTWISGRTELFVAFFYLLSVGLFMWHVEKRSRLLYISSLFAFIGALLSKEMAITLPFIVLLYALLFQRYSYVDSRGRFRDKPAPALYKGAVLSGIVFVMLGLVFNPFVIANYFSPDGVLEQATVRNIRFLQLGAVFGGCSIIIYSAIMRYLPRTSRLGLSVQYAAPYFIILSAYFIVRIYIVGGLGGYQSSGGNLFLQFGLDAFLRDIFALAGLVWPMGITYNIDVLTLQIEHTGVFYAVSILAGVGLALILMASIRYSRELTFCFLWVFVVLAPTHNILINSWHFQPRYLYLPSVGFCIFVALALYKWAYGRNGASTIRRGLVVTGVVSITILNAVSVMAHNDVLSEGARITEELVATIQKNESELSEKNNWVFLTYPISSNETPNALFITWSMQEVLNYADRAEGYHKGYRYQFIVFSRGGENAVIRVTRQGAGEFILESSGDTKYFFMPRVRSSRENEIEGIYKVLPPHMMLQPLPGEGRTEETEDAFITVVEVNEQEGRVKLQIRLKEPSHESGENQFFVFTKGQFRRA